MLNFSQMLKTSQPEKKQPVTPKHQNGALQKRGAGEKRYSKKIFKDIPKNNFSSKLPDSRKTEDSKTAKSSVVHKDSQVKIKDSGVSETIKSAAQKRKKDNKKSNSEPAAKKSSVVQETKPTE